MTITSVGERKKLKSFFDLEHIVILYAYRSPHVGNMSAQKQSKIKRSKNKAGVCRPQDLIVPFECPVTLPLMLPSWFIINIIKLSHLLPPKKECAFCKENGERFELYTSHSLRRGRRVECPILRGHVCEICGATGDRAHTRSYCPMKERLSDEQKKKLYNSTVLKRTKYTAAGRRFVDKAYSNKK